MESGERVPLRVVDLFCGAGGMALGFRSAGCRIQSAVDVDTAAGETFARNLSLLQRDDPPLVFAGEEFDLEALELRTISAIPPDILVGGPPCQGFSKASREIPGISSIENSWTPSAPGDRSRW
jgi:DNA (cytosine-5)-methyltransferase 1